MKIRQESQEALLVIEQDYRKRFGKEVDIGGLKETLLSTYAIIGEGDSCPKEYWDEVQTIFKVGDKLIRASIAYSKKGESPEKRGWTFDPNSLAIVFPVKVMITRYKTLEEMHRYETH